MVVNADYYENRCSKCPPSALIHACSLFLNVRTAFLMDSCGKSFQIAFRALFSVLSYLSASVCRLDISQAYSLFVSLVNVKFRYFSRKFITFEFLNILQSNLVKKCENISSISRAKIVQKYL